MADIFSKLGDSLKNTIKEAAHQTQKSVDQATLRTEILTKKNDLKKLYLELGKKHYEIYKSGAEEEVPSELYDKITKLSSEIDENEQKLDSVLNEQKDSFNNFKNDMKSQWAEGCTEKSEEDIVDTECQEEDQDKDESKEVEVMKICELCNTGNHIHAAYCSHCGNKFE